MTTRPSPPPVICSRPRRCRSRRRATAPAQPRRSPSRRVTAAAPVTATAGLTATAGQYRRAAADAERVERPGLAAPPRQRLCRLHARPVSRCAAAGGDGRGTARAHGRPWPQLPADRRSVPGSGCVARLGAGGSRRVQDGCDGLCVPVGGLAGGVAPQPAGVGRPWAVAVIAAFGILARGRQPAAGPARRQAVPAALLAL